MEWKEVRLGDVCEIKGGKRLPKGINLITQKNSHPYIRVRDLGKSKTLELNSSYEYVDEITQKQIQRYITLKGDILISIVGTIGLIAIVGGSLNGANLTENCVKLVKLDNIDSEFLYYYLKSPLGQQNISRGTVGAVQAKLPIKNIQEFNINCPVLISDQRRIASILSSLDRKIELNNKINADLEEMAQAIFKNWFVDFEPFKDGKFVDSELGMIPEGWKVGKITDIGCLITDYVSNGSFASLKQNVHLYETKEYAQFIRNTDLKTNTFSVYVDKHSYDFLSKSTLYGNEIIISNVGDVGSVHLCPKLDIPMTLGNNIIMLRPNEKEYNYFLYLWFKYFSGQALIQGIKGGSAQPKFNKTDFKNLPLLIPSFEIIERSYWIFESMFSILSSNVKENSRLSLLRDTLLPRLMSGELEVPE